MSKNIYTHPATPGCYYIKQADRYYVSNSFGSVINRHTPSAMVRGFVGHDGVVIQKDRVVTFMGDNIIVDQISPTMGGYVDGRNYFERFNEAVDRRGGLRVFLDSGTEPDSEDDVLIGTVVGIHRHFGRYTVNVKLANEKAGDLIRENLDSVLCRPKIFASTKVNRHVINEPYGQVVVSEIKNFERMYIRGVSLAECQSKAVDYARTMFQEKK